MNISNSFAAALLATIPFAFSVDASATDRPEHVNRCLMSVTGTAGLTPQQEAYRKVRCYEGTRYLADLCESSVGATMRLDSATERHYREQCRQVTPN